jgi:hypothetical protein
MLSNYRINEQTLLELFAVESELLSSTNPSTFSIGASKVPRISLRPVMLAGLSAVALQASAVAGETATLSVTIKNVATDKTLKLPDGMTAAAPIAPGAYAVVTDGVKPFELGKPAVAGLESLAEDGNAEAFIARLNATKGVRDAGMFVPGQAFDVMAQPGDRLVFATMFVQSNDLFLAPDPKGIALFDAAQKPCRAMKTAAVKLWDAGAEKNEAPGVGPDQAPRQTMANSGPEERGVVQPVENVHDGFAYPPIAEVVKLTVAAQ